ncbi:MAG TPA: hypothetical protein VG206_26210 [Terriglobia bacterium]|nr:hypothetical protein [Terriglobia bacterium]
MDLIADFDTGRKYSLFDRVALENRLTDILGVPVDLSPAATLKDPVRRKAAREAVLAFGESSLPLRDIVASIDAIESFTAGMDFEAFRADAKTMAAVERVNFRSAGLAFSLEDCRCFLRQTGPGWRRHRRVMSAILPN